MSGLETHTCESPFVGGNGSREYGWNCWGIGGEESGVHLYTHICIRAYTHTCTGGM